MTEKLDFNERVAKLDPQGQAILRALIEVVIDIVEQPHLPAVLLRVVHLIPAGGGMAIAHLSAHRLGGEPYAVDNMMLDFMAARAAMDTLNEPNQQRH